jgi:phage gp45-like
MRRIESIRGIIKSITATAGALMRFSASGRPGETIDDREIMQQYGIQSRPPEGAECMILREGNHLVMIASDDRRYRIGLDSGEIAIVSDEGDKVHLQRGKKLRIESGNTVDVHSSGNVKINATAEVTVTAPAVKLGNGAIIDTAQGVVTQQCACIWGALHPQGSLATKSTL